MFSEELKKIKSDTISLRKFGLIFGGVLLFWAGLLFWKNKSAYIYFFIVSLLCALTAVFFPLILKPVHKSLVIVGILWGWLLGKLTLIIVFFLAFTPISLLAKLFRKRFLDLKIDKSSKTYWVSKENDSFSPQDCQKQF